MLGKQTGFYTVEPKYIDDMVTYIKLGRGQGGTDPPPGDWCLGLVPPPRDPQKFGKIMRLMHKNAIKLKN